ncbi:hypothetical protein DFQ27_005109 [Actinomortierella ambigua]|uniref:Methyltransferase domain-containing protein n=1 Tax=Actinomortierella ambigua TaxID=1343610 RepID=A0A9P6QIP3_9FUNG|nr:hypothetical protein DFQ27_005109 [Actinomortierella ambigua]
MGSSQSVQGRLHKRKPTQQELQREYQRHLSDQQLQEHLTAREALVAQFGAGGSIIGSLANNESFYQQRSITNQSTTAVRASGRNFRWIDGRRHHNHEGAPYILPNDTEEMDRLHLQHYVVRHAFSGNTRAKFDGKIHRDVLDVGCGPGTWILEMSTEHTETNFTGIDISAVWPTEIRPRNCRFQVINAFEGLPFDDNTFDFVYQRFMIMAYPATAWPFVVSELVRVTKPGGIIELTECPVSTKANGPEMERLLAVLESGCNAKGLDTKAAKKLEGWLKDAGLESVTACHASIPVGSWGSKVGQLMKENTAALWTSLRGFIKELTGMNDQQYEAVIRRIMAECEVSKCYTNCYCAWGIKPFPPGESPNGSKDSSIRTGTASNRNSRGQTTDVLSSGSFTLLDTSRNSFSSSRHANGPSPSGASGGGGGGGGGPTSARGSFSAAPSTSAA